MGISTRIAGLDWIPDPQTYSVQENSTPIAVTDSSGAVGTFAVAYPAGKSFTRWLRAQGREITLTDSHRGFILGTVDNITESHESGLVTLNCISRLGLLNIYNIQAQPFSGTLGQAFAYYLSLAGVTAGFTVEESIRDRPVAITGWFGELWYNLKALAAAQKCEISLVSGMIVLRPIRQREAIRGREIARSPGLPGNPIAQFVEVYHYETRPIVNAPVYEYDPEGEILSVGAGESVEHVLELDASLTSVQQPEHRMDVPPEYNHTSVYTVVGDDGLPITPAAWKDKGGSLSVTINEDTTSVTVHLTGATGLPSVNGEELKTFSIALAAESTARYPTLRLVGTGVTVTKTLHRFATGVPAERSQQEVGVTVDNPFLTELDDVYSAGARAAREYAGRKLTLSGTATAINQIGDRGTVGLPTYADIKAKFAGKTYAQVKADPINAGRTYRQVREHWRQTRQDEYDNQVFGNAGGARVWHERSKRFYRIRSANYARETLTFSAEDDLNYADMKRTYSGLTYAQVKARYEGATYAEAAVLGVIDG